MSCRRAEDACAALLSSCRAHATSCLSRRPRGTRALSTARDACSPRQRPARPPRRAPSCDARRTVYTYVGGKLQQRDPVLRRDFTEGNEPARNLPKNPPKVAIIGGGVTGLTAAHYLSQDLPPGSRIVLYEGDSRVGGWLRSERVPVDVGGVKSEVLFERGPRMMSTGGGNDSNDKLVMFDLILNTALPRTNGNEHIPRFIYHNKSLVPAPTSANLVELLQNPLVWEVGPSALFYYFLHAVIGIGYEPPTHDMSLAEWADRLFKTPKLETPLSAMMHGIWGGDIHKLSALSVLGTKFRTPFQPNSEILRAKEWRFLNNFINEDRNKHDYEGGFTGRQLFFGKHGLDSLPLALADSLGSASNVEIRLGDPVKDLSYNSTTEEVMVTDSKNKVESYDKVISALPAHQLAKITSNKLPQLASFPAATIMTVNIWYPFEDVVPKGLGYLIPSTAPYEDNPERALGVFFDSHVGIGDAGPGGSEPGTKVFVLLGGHYYEGMDPPSEGQAIEQAKAVLERHLGVPRDTPCYATSRLAPNCLPQHLVGHNANVTKLSEQLERRFGNRLAAVGGSFGKPGVVPAARAGYDIASAVAREDFLSNGLEDYVDAEVLEPRMVHLVKVTKEEMEDMSRTKRPPPS